IEHARVPMPWSGLGEKKESPPAGKTSREQPPEARKPVSPQGSEKSLLKTDEVASTGAPEKQAVEQGREASEPVAGGQNLPPPEQTDQGKGLPNLLGQLILGKSETLGGMIQKIYGIYTNQHLKWVAKVNQEMANPDLLQTGQLIRFPAVPVNIEESLEKCWWVQSARKDKLEDAYQFVKSYQSDVPGIRMIPCWNEKDGLKFVIIHKTYFKDQGSARAYVERLPPKLSAGVQIINEWGRDTVFFADPILKTSSEEGLSAATFGFGNTSSPQ
ncbi:MAG: hypothetical protein V1689_15385, partial [Pseudomonadota bacterium]